MSCSSDANGGNSSLIVGRSEHAAWLREEAAWGAGRFGNGVITGETGAGKGVFLKEMRRLSPGTPFKRIGVPALADELRHSQLFGHLKGSFSGAHHTTAGFLEAANGGLLPLDDAQALENHVDLQNVLLDVAEGCPVPRLGGTEGVPVRVRLFLLLQRPLSEYVAEGALRRDLAERVDQFAVHLKALREHAEDIQYLAPHMLRQEAAREHFPVLGIRGEVLDLFMRHHWPGNVRQLGNVLGKALTNAIRQEAGAIRAQQLPAAFLAEVRGNGKGTARSAARRLTEADVRKALDRTGGNVRRASILLGCTERNVWYWIKARGIPIPCATATRHSRDGAPSVT